MKKTVLIVSLVSVLLACQAEGPTEKSKTLKVEKTMEVSTLSETIENFIKAADKNDVKRLESLLHPSFQILWADGKGGVSIVDRTTYLKNIETKKWGGDNRTFKILSSNKFDNTTAVVQVEVKGKANFNSFYSLANDNGKWKILTDFVYMK